MPNIEQPNDLMARFLAMQRPEEQPGIVPAVLGEIVGSGAALFSHAIAKLTNGQDSEECVEAINQGLRERADRARSGDLTDAFADLTAQCAYLNVVVAHLAGKACGTKHPAAVAVFWGLMFRAQQCSARTAAALAALVLAQKQAEAKLRVISP